MSNFIHILISALSAIIFMFLLIPVVKKVAIKYQLVDKPNARKVHAGAIPLVGGICIALTVLLSALLNMHLMVACIKIRWLLASALVLLLMGVLDDKVDLKASRKLMIQLLCGLSIAMADIRITSLYGIFGVYEISLWLQYCITIILITGIVNAMNLMDGVDGLLGELSLLGFIILIVLSLYLNEIQLACLYTCFAGALIVFLKFNLSNEKIFMGDAGSLFLGNMLIGSFIYLLNKIQYGNSDQQAYFLALLIGFFALPVLDSLRVYLGRMKVGNSPFKADKSHIHHLLLLFNYSHKKVGLIVIVLSLIFLAIGLLFSNLVNYLNMILILLAIYSFLSLLLNLNKKVFKWLERIKQLEH